MAVEVDEAPFLLCTTYIFLLAKPTVLLEVSDYTQ